MNRHSHTYAYIHTHIYIIIIIILSCHQHWYPWPFLAISPDCSSLLADPQGYILYHHRAAVCRFELVSLLLLGYGEHHLWARPRSPTVFYMSGSSNIIFVMGCRWPYSWCFVGCCLHFIFVYKGFSLYDLVKNIPNNDHFENKIITIIIIRIIIIYHQFISTTKLKIT